MEEKAGSYHVLFFAFSLSLAIQEKQVLYLYMIVYKCIVDKTNDKYPIFISAKNPIILCKNEYKICKIR